MKKTKSEVAVLTRFLEEINGSVVAINRNLDTLINVTGRAKKKIKLTRAGFASYSVLQTTRFLPQAHQTVKRKRCKN